MAFGSATPLIQQALLTLLQGQNPSPLAPVPSDVIGIAGDPPAPVPLAPAQPIGPLDLETQAALAALQPQPVPPALPGPVDADAIRARFAGLAGPEPVAPVAGPDPLILKIARALQGFGAGTQGQGPQFIAGLREERERPQREFQAKKERFDTRKQELGVMAEQAVLSAEDRRAARTLDLLDRQAERDYQAAASKAGFKKQEALVRMKEAFDLERDAKKAEFERLEQERKDAKERKAAITTLANTLTDDFKISRQQARRFAEFELEGTPLSAADAKQYSRIEKYRRPVGGTGAGSSGKVMVEILNEDGSTSVVPFASVSSAINAGTVTQGPRGVFIEGQGVTRPPDVKGASPEGFPLAPGAPGGPAPFAPQEPAAKPGTVFTRAEIEAHAKRTKRDPKAVEADIRARGGIVQ